MYSLKVGITLLILALVEVSVVAGACVECDFSHTCISIEDGGCWCDVKTFPITGGNLINYCRAPGFCATIGPNLCPGDDQYPPVLRTGMPPYSSLEKDLPPLKPESPYKAKSTVLRPELGLDLVKRSITVPRHLVVELLGLLEQGKDQAQVEELEVLVLFFELSEWQLASDLHNATAGVRGSDGTMRLSYRFDEIEVLDMGISFTVRNGLEKRAYRATFDWSNPKVLRGEQPVTFFITDLVY